MTIERDIEREIRFHFDSRIAELMAGGLSRDEARARATAEFGDIDDVKANLRVIDKRVARRRSRADWMEGVRQDVAYAARTLWRSPAVSFTIVITLALGLGVNAAMFSLLDVVFLRSPAGVVHPEEIRRVWAERRFSNGTQFWPGYDYSQFNALSEAARQFADLTLYSHPELRTLGRTDNVTRVAVAGTMDTYFSVLGLKPQAGRFFDANESRVNSNARVAVISDAFWRRQFDGDAGAVGQQLVIARETFTVIGVASPRFSGTELNTTDVWLPLSTFIGGYSPDRKPWWQSPNVNGFQVIMRLHKDAREAVLTQQTTMALRAPGIGYKQDTLVVSQFGSIIAARGPGTLDTAVRVATRAAGVAFIVLLIACANVVNLLLARAVKRRREIAVRLALGISRSRLVRMLITESVLLALVAVFVALVAAHFGGLLLRTLLMPEIHFAEMPLHWRVMLSALLASILAGALAGLIPALQSAAPNLGHALKEGSRAVAGHRSRLRNMLIVTQAALSVVLLVGAALFVRSLHNVKAHDIGFAVDRLAFAHFGFEVPDSTRDAQLPMRTREMAPRVSAIPGVDAVAFTSMRPRAGMMWVDFFPDADTVGRKMPDGFYTVVSPNYFRVTGTRLMSGRTFDSTAMRGAPLEVVINKAFSDALWPDVSPLGRCIRFRADTAPCATIVGVVQTAILNSIDETPSPHVYFSYNNPVLGARLRPTIIMRTAPNRMATVQKDIQQLIRGEFPGATPSVTTMNKIMEPEYRPWQLGATLFTLFGLLALVVAAIGIYSTVSYAVNQRTHEFGVRIALGATAANVLSLVLRDGLRVVGFGVALGIVLAIAAGRLVASLLYDVSASDPVSMVVVALGLLAIAALAAMVPARRAANADPLEALRAE